MLHSTANVFRKKTVRSSNEIVHVAFFYPTFTCPAVLDVRAFTYRRRAFQQSSAFLSPTHLPIILCNFFIKQIVPLLVVLSHHIVIETNWSPKIKGTRALRYCETALHYSAAILYRKEFVCAYLKPWVPWVDRGVCLSWRRITNED